MSKKLSVFVISLDFEMMWGVKDFATPKDYGQSNVAHVFEVIKRLLELFKHFDIHATFATVGYIFCKDKNEVIQYKPALLPTYSDRSLSPYENDYIEEIKESDSRLYFAPEIVDTIFRTNGLELATHTASHYNCLAEGQTVEQFKEDMKTAIRIADDKGYKLETIIFPKNQVGDEYLKVCADNGIKTFRGSKTKNKTNYSKLSVLWERGIRLIDNYIPLLNSKSYNLSEVHEGRIMNVKASRFLRPYSSKLSFLEWLRFRRVKGEMSKAAKNGEVYHLWWHPHNFGADIDRNFKFLEKILKHFRYCHEKYGMISLNMKEVADLIENNHG